MVLMQTHNISAEDGSNKFLQNLGTIFTRLHRITFQKTGIFMKSIIFWRAMLASPVDVHQHLRGM
jgi:hypothetical protein